MIKIPDFIYPKDEQGRPVCPRCRKPIAACDCPSVEPPKPKAVQVHPHIRLEKSGRHGKCVTLIEHLPSSEQYLKDLAKKLKVKTGSGGTYYQSDGSGTIEIQGDHQKVISQFFSKKL